MKHSLWLRLSRLLYPLVVGLCFYPLPATCQDSSDEGTMLRGSRAELVITVYDSSGQIVKSSTTVKIYKDGAVIDQSSTSDGRVFFVPRGHGDFTVAVQAAGYKSEQKEVTVTPSTKTDVAVYLQKIPASNESAGVPGEPVLAPKAKDALLKALQSVGKNKPDEAQKHLNDALKLAPNNPEVLYVQGLVYLQRSAWADAQSVLQKSDQLEPNQPRVLAALGSAFCNQKKYDQAIPLLEKSLQLNPTSNLETEWTLAKSYYYHGQYEQALKVAQQVRSESHGNIPQIDLLLAQCLTAVGRYEDSAQVLRDFLKKNANSPDAATARRWLDGLAANGKIPPQSTPTP
jgi:outer membrane protein assembly factor BamD (BamD/ComL family)